MEIVVHRMVRYASPPQTFPWEGGRQTHTQGRFQGHANYGYKEGGRDSGGS